MQMNPPDGTLSSAARESVGKLSSGSPPLDGSGRNIKLFAADSARRFHF